MSFRDISLKLTARGIPVVPVECNSKRTRLAGWPALATTNEATIEYWNKTDPSANVGAVAKIDRADGIVILDCDVAGLVSRIEQETGQKFPETFTVTSAGKRLPHLYFRHTPNSRLLGNRKMAGAFDLKAHNGYVVGPGSVIATDGGPRTYDIANHADIAPFPDWLCDWISVNTQPEQKSGTCHTAAPVSDHFDVHAFMDHYGLTYQMKGNWFITDVCPVSGTKHKQSTETGFYYDGETFGFKCFAANCPGSDMHVGDVIKHLNKGDGKTIVQPFPGEIWPKAQAPLDPEVAGADWFVQYHDFRTRVIPPRTKLLIDKETNGAVLYSESLNQIFSFRGIGKSLFVAGLVNVLLDGGEFLRYTSPGGFRVLYCDGELTDSVLQERLAQQIKGSGDRLTLMFNGSLPNGAFPRLGEESWQSEFVKRLDAVKPDVIVFDTLTACFRFDTNDPDAWDRVNQFYINLRQRGYCVIIVHHAGKNGSQRGRTDGDDNLDLAVKLSPPRGWEPGDGLKFNLNYEKVRAGGRLKEFYAEYDDLAGWTMPTPETETEVIRLKLAGKSYVAIAKELDISKSKVQRMVEKARKAGVEFKEEK